MNGNKVVLDSNIIIFTSKGKVNVEKMFGDFDEFFISIISYIEIYGYDFENTDEIQVIDTLLKKIGMVNTD